MGDEHQDGQRDALNPRFAARALDERRVTNAGEDEQQPLPRSDNRRPTTMPRQRILALQRAVGNAATLRLLKTVVYSTTTVQRQAASGLAADEPTAEFAQAAHSYWTANKTALLKDFAADLVKWVNTKLTHGCTFALTSKGYSSFDRATWTLSVDPQSFSQDKRKKTVGDLDKDEVAEIVDTIYHESRHSEQFFRIAQVQAGRGKPPEEIANGMTIPMDVAMLASKSTLTGSSQRNTELIDEATSWEQFTIGKYRAYREAVLDTKDDATSVAALFPAQSQLKTFALDIRIAGDKAYRDFAEEKDAFAVGGKVKQAFISHVTADAVALPQPKGAGPVSQAAKQSQIDAAVETLRTDLTRLKAIQLAEHPKDQLAGEVQSHASKIVSEIENFLMNGIDRGKKTQAPEGPADGAEHQEAIQAMLKPLDVVLNLFTRTERAADMRPATAVLSEAVWQLRLSVSDLGEDDENLDARVKLIMSTFEAFVTAAKAVVKALDESAQRDDDTELFLQVADTKGLEKITEELNAACLDVLEGPQTT